MIPRSIVRVLGTAGWRPARQLGAGLDLALAAGPGYARQRWRDQRQGLSIDSLPFFRQVWAEAAREVGAELDELGEGFFELRDGEASTRVWYHWVPLEDIVASQLALDKPQVHRLLTAARVPVPEHREFHFKHPDPALDFLADAAPCVIKPASGTSGGGGVTSGLRTPAQLLRACMRASRGGDRLLVESEAQGAFYRLLFLDGELLDVVRRLPPAVTGDGRRTIAELIAAENARRRAARGSAGLRVLTVDLDCLLALERRGLGPRSVPDPGERVPVKGVVSQNAARENETVREPLAPELIDAASRAARAVGVRLAGVDVITSDPSRPPAETGAVILEVNATPGFQYHYQVADPQEATRIAVPILRRALAEAGAGG